VLKDTVKILEYGSAKGLYIQADHTAVLPAAAQGVDQSDSVNRMLA